jgi:hypothetical protein
MAPVRHLALRRGAEVPQLGEHEQADHPIGTDPQRDDAEQDRDLGAGTQHDIGHDQAGDRARGANQLDPGMQVVGDEDKPADDAAKKIESEIAPAAERPFDVVAEHPQEHHVAEEVRNIRVEELVGEDRRERRHPPACLHVAGESRRREAESIDHPVERELAGPRFIEEHGQIDRDQTPRHHRLHRRGEGIVVVDRNDHQGFVPVTDSGPVATARPTRPCRWRASLPRTENPRGG